MDNVTTNVWRARLRRLLQNPDFTVKPRGMEVRELMMGSYTVPMPAFINLKARKVKRDFLFAEPAWILSGSNRLSAIEPYMSGFRKFSDDEEFMGGAYGPKVVDQLPYVVNSLLSDQDSRQAVLTIWRERPYIGKDMPCTVALQFFIREGKLHLMVFMRSQDIVLGFTYDVFTFSMVAESVRRLLRAKGLEVVLGDLHLMAGSLHLYKTHYNDANTWLEDSEWDTGVDVAVAEMFDHSGETYDQLVERLWYQARREQELRSEKS